MNTLEIWINAACGELGLSPSNVDTKAVLDLARDVAHQVERPAAPVTAFMLGLAVGAGQPLEDATGRLRALANNWQTGNDREAGSGHPIA